MCRRLAKAHQHLMHLLEALVTKHAIVWKPALLCFLLPLCVEHHVGHHIKCHSSTTGMLVEETDVDGILLILFD